jgi:beta-1,4-mannosyl-glycoprotein beta-1,4-N-acetylglucosaminyltransferase
MLSDVDEIPNPAAIRRFCPRRYISAVLVQRMYYYAFNNQMVSSDDPKDVPWRAARITTRGRLNDWFGSMQSLRGFRASGPLRSLRRLWNKALTQQIPEGGWHFSYLMTAEQIQQKIAAFSHQELNLPQVKDAETIRRAIRQRSDIFGGNRHFEVVPIDASFPAPLRADRDRYREWIF